MFQCESQRAEKGRFAILFEQGEIVGEPVGLNTIGSKIAFVKIGTVGARDHLAGGMCRVSQPGGGVLPPQLCLVTGFWACSCKDK